MERNRGNGYYAFKAASDEASNQYRYPVAIRRQLTNFVSLNTLTGHRWTTRRFHDGPLGPCFGLVQRGAEGSRSSVTKTPLTNWVVGRTRASTHASPDYLVAETKQSREAHTNSDGDGRARNCFLNETPRHCKLGTKQFRIVHYS
ncbi:hypothetical protein B0T16DRAFT_45006 [Cercophora newfieldiana]|uniref:Uncharacterized protein n=1 Tax=Cercophora newfieldiana TaxID=92897 RepID=A0AA39YS82_9PEZI|nr:hypothetical protein B0T16DRAFT_45006 [Cercophora newfieldiana]